MSDHEARIRAHTEVTAPWLCPELAMHLITHTSKLWYLTEDQVHAMGWDTPYWGFAWPGGQSLARHLLDHPSLVAGRTVLDFGAGGAIEGLAAMRCGARRVLCTDIDPMAMTAIDLNAALNNVTLERTTDDVIGRDDPAWEVVLAGDVFYEPEFSTRVFAWLAGLARRGALVLLGDPYRGNVPDAGVEVLGHYDASFDTDPRGEHLRRAQVARVR